MFVVQHIIFFIVYIVYIVRSIPEWHCVNKSLKCSCWHTKSVQFCTVWCVKDKNVLKQDNERRDGCHSKATRMFHVCPSDHSKCVCVFMSVYECVCPPGSVSGSHSAHSVDLQPPLLPQTLADHTKEKSTVIMTRGHVTHTHTQRLNHWSGLEEQHEKKGHV